MGSALSTRGPTARPRRIWESSGLWPPRDYALGRGLGSRIASAGLRAARRAWAGLGALGRVGTPSALDEALRAYITLRVRRADESLSLGPTGNRPSRKFVGHPTTSQRDKYRTTAIWNIARYFHKSISVGQLVATSFLSTTDTDTKRAIWSRNLKMSAHIVQMCGQNLRCKTGAR